MGRSCERKCSGQRAIYGGIVLAAGGIPFADVACADEPDPFSLSIEQLFDATVISASRDPESLKNASAAIYVISGEDIRHSGATSIPEALRLAPGVNVARTHNGGWAISVRGFSGELTNKLLVLIDGREVYDPLFSGVYWDVQDTAIEDIDRIEIVRGPGGTLWGANAVNGVINIITKPASATQGALLSLNAGNQERAVATARYGGAAADGALHWRAYAKYADRRPQMDVGSGSDAPDYWRTARGGFRLDWEGGKDAITLQGDAYKSDTREIRAGYSFAPPYNFPLIESTAASGGNVLGKWSRSVDGQSQLAVQLYVDLTQRDQYALDDRRTTVDLDTQYHLRALPSQDVIFGFGYRATHDSFRSSPLVTSAATSNAEQRVNAFVQDRIELPARLSLTLGSKFEHNDFTGFEVQPSVRLQWRGESQTAWAAVSRAVRTPSELERDFHVLAGVIPPGPLPVPVSVELTPSPGFESEGLLAYEAGYRRQWSGVELDVTGFYNIYTGLSTLSFAAPQIGFAPLHLILPIVTTNSSRARSYGFEGVLNWQATNRLRLSATYSFLALDLTGPPSEVAIDSEGAETQSPRNLATLSARWSLTPSVALDSTAYYTDAIPGFGLDSHIRFDERVSWQVSDTTALEIVGQDLFDNSRVEFGNETALGATAIRRSVYARLVWRK
jgi:iron complex outermembrane recepter protein